MPTMHEQVLSMSRLRLTHARGELAALPFYAFKRRIIIRWKIRVLTAHLEEIRNEFELGRQAPQGYHRMLSMTFDPAQHTPLVHLLSIPAEY